MKKSIFITGGAQGIGFATAKVFLERDWLVGILDFERDKLDSVRKIFPEILTYHADVTDFQQVEKALRSFASANEGKIDVLHNNAGITLVGEFTDIDLEVQQKVVDINLKGVINVAYAAIPFLEKAQKSVIVNMSSASSLYGNPELTVYAATKSAVKSLTEAWNISLNSKGIRVTDIIPIYVKTRMVDDHYDEFRKLGPSDIKLTPEMIANKVWKAVHGSKIHYYAGADTKLFAFLLRFLPQKAAPAILKKVIGYHN